MTIAAIVTNFNYENYISRCLESLINQTVPFDQIIVVDDGSTDNSKEVLSRFSEKVSIIFKKNGGPLSCYYAAFEKLTTDYFYTLDADDWAYPNLVEKVRPVLQGRPAKVQFQLQGVSSQGTFGTVFPPFPENYDQEKILKDNVTIGFYISPPTSGNVFSRKLVSSLTLDQWGPNTNIDGTPSLVMPYMGEIITIKEPLVNYFIHDKNISGVGNFTTEKLKAQISDFTGLWNTARGLEKICLPPWPRLPTFLAERYLLLRTREGNIFLFKEIFVFIRGLIGTNYAAKAKIMLFCWASLFLIPIPKFQNYLVDIRVNGTKRPSWLRSKRS